MLTQTVITNTIKGFLESVKPKINAGGNSICSFAIQVNSINKKFLLEKLTEHQTSFYVQKKGSAITAFAFNPIYEVVVDGNDRFQKIETILNSQSDNIFYSVLHEEENLPLYFGGMKFTPNEEDSIWSEFSDANWFVPKVAVVSFGEKSYFIYNFIFENYNSVDAVSDEYENLKTAFTESDSQEPGSARNEFSISLTQNDDRRDWQLKVEEIKSLIGAGEFEKVVLARSICGNVENVRIPSLIEKLETKNVNADIFCYKKGETFFFGATPEKMLSLNGRSGQTESLAGSIRRGATKEEDRILENELFNSTKDIEEQKIVTKILIDSLNEVCENLRYSNETLIKKAKHVQHLWNLIEFTLKDGVSMFQLLEKIFPTPATCGYPVRKAEALIKKMESQPRGMYAGLIGFFNMQNFGEFLVAIRSAVISKNNFTAFAGSGIVANSNAAKEFAETELKFSSILSVFTNENQ